MNGHNIVPRAHPCSSVDVNGLDAPIFTLHRLILATLCALAALLFANTAQADSLRANLQGREIHDRIEFDRRSRELDIRLSPSRCRHSRPSIRGGQTPRLDDSTLNDSNRLFIVWSAPVRSRLTLVGDATVCFDATPTNFTYRRRPPRGPPTLLVS